MKARREIVLAAGAPHSPQVLQLSGIGPKKLLSGLGIKTLVDLPGVGENFQDQPTMYMQFTCKPSPFRLSLPRSMTTLTRKQTAITPFRRLTG